MVVEMVTLVAGLALVLLTYDRLAAMLLAAALRADAIRVTTPDPTCEAIRFQLGHLLQHAVPSIADGAPTEEGARPGLKKLKVTEGNEA